MRKAALLWMKRREGKSVLTAALSARGDSVEGNQIKLQEERSNTKSGAGYCSCWLLCCEKPTQTRAQLCSLCTSGLPTPTWSAVHLLRTFAVILLLEHTHLQGFQL